MRKLFIVLALIIILGGYFAYWHKKADEFRVMLESSIANLNDQAKTLGGNTTLIRYDSIAISGFPFAMTLEIIKPVVDLPVTTLLLKFFPQTVSPSLATAANPPVNWVEEITYGESVSVTGNFTGNHFTLKASGDRTHKTMLGNSLHRTLVGSSSSPFVCHLKVEQDKGAPWTMRPVFTDLPTFIAIFREGDCDVKGVTLKDAGSNVALYTAESVSFKSSNEASGTANRKLVFESDYKNAKATPALDGVVNDYTQLTRTAMGLPGKGLDMIPFSEYGLMNSKIDMRYEGPTDQAGMAASDASMKFDINAFDFKNDLNDSTLVTHVRSVPEKDHRVGSIEMHAKSEFSPRSDQLMSQQFASMLGEMEQHPEANPSARQFAQALARLGNTQDIANQIFPQLHGLGKMAFDVDVKLEGPNQPGNYAKQGIYTINALDLVTTPYGIKQKGNVNFSTVGKAPSGEWVLTCISCDALITDLGNYAMRFDSLVARAQSQPAHVTPDLIEGVRQFIHGIAENPAAGSRDLVIHVLAKNTGEITVSGKQILQLLGLYGSTIAPHLVHAQTLSPNVPAPPVGGVMPMPPAEPAAGN